MSNWPYDDEIRLEAEIEALQEQVAALTAERDAARFDANNNLNVVDRMLDEQATYQRTIAALTAELAQAREYLAARQTAIEGLAAGVNQRAAEVARLEANYNTVSTRLIEQSRQLSALEVENAALRERLAVSWQPLDGCQIRNEDRDVIAEVEGGGEVLLTWAWDLEEPFSVPLILPPDLRLCRQLAALTAERDALRQRVSELKSQLAAAQEWQPVGNMSIRGADNSLITTGADGAWITVCSDIDEPEYDGTAVLPPTLRLCRRTRQEPPA